MKTAMPVTQRGLSFAGFISGAFLLVIVGVVVLRLVPAYVENAQINKIFATIANDPEMQGADIPAIRTSFDRRASIDNIAAIKSDDIKIVRTGRKLMLSADYDVKLPLVGNVSLYLEFNPTSAE